MTSLSASRYPAITDVGWTFFLTSPFALFKSSLCSQSVDLSLSIRSSFLKFSKSLNFLLFLFMNSFLFSKMLLFSLSFQSIIINNFLFKLLLLKYFLMLDLNCLFISMLNLSHQYSCLSSLFFSLSDFFLLQILNLFQD